MFQSFTCLGAQEEPQTDLINMSRKCYCKTEYIALLPSFFTFISIPGTRTFGGIHVAGIQVCGVLACSSNYSPDLKDCVPTPGPQTTLPEFKHLKLVGRFSAGRILSKHFSEVYGCQKSIEFIRSLVVSVQLLF